MGSVVQGFENEGGLILLRWEERSEGGRVAYVTVNNEEKRNALPVEAAPSWRA